jgi:hypothetical protein
MPITATLPWSVRLTHTRSSIRPTRLLRSPGGVERRVLDDRTANQPAPAHLARKPSPYLCPAGPRRAPRLVRLCAARPPACTIASSSLPVRKHAQEAKHVSSGRRPLAAGSARPSRHAPTSRSAMSHSPSTSRHPAQPPSRTWWRIEAQRLHTDWSSLLRQRIRVLWWIRAAARRWHRG